MAYDSYGRLEKVWLPGRASADSASTTYTYKVAPNGYSGIKTSTLRNAAGTRDDRYDLVDGWGRSTETQVNRVGENTTGRVVRATRYDEHGQPWLEIPAVPAPNSSQAFWDPVNPILTEVDRHTQHDHDALGRTTRTRQMRRGAALPGAETATTYHGTWIQTVPPTPLGATRTYSDGLGRTTKVEQFHQLRHRHPHCGRSTTTTPAPTSPRSPHPGRARPAAHHPAPTRSAR